MRGRLRISGNTVGMPIDFPLACQRDIFHRKPVRGRAKLPSLPTFRHDDGIANPCVSSLSSSYERIQCEKISRTYRTSRNKLHLLPDGETITPGQLVDNTVILSIDDIYRFSVCRTQSASHFVLNWKGSPVPWLRLVISVRGQIPATLAR